MDVNRADPLLEFGGGDHLVVVLHGFANPGNRMAEVRMVVREALPAADIYAPRLPYADGFLCRVKAATIVAKVIQRIEKLVADRVAAGSPYGAITLVGHSCGAVLARKIAIVAHGEQRNKDGTCPAPFEHEFDSFQAPRSWAKLIDRIVLLAGMNRGWSVASTRSWATSVLWSIGQLFLEIFFKGKATMMDIRKGAPFLVQTRLQWLALMDPEFGARPRLIAAQLLGSTDDHVAPDDNIDFSVDTFGNVGGHAYFYLEMPFSTHANVIEIAQLSKAHDTLARVERRNKFLVALTGSREALNAASVKREQLSDSLPPEPDHSVTDLVFVIHGIRDRGFWTQKIARTIKKQPLLDGRKFVSSTESYGYFAMAPFLFRTVRQRKVEWLMDHYTEARARFPRAAFHFVGHSNGTYLAAQALSDYPSARFENIVFAGSVVRTDYDWLRLINMPEGSKVAPRVKRVLNYVATTDWVVALFPKGLQMWRWFNLGGAGHDGFTQALPGGPVFQVKFIPGSHGAGLDECHWDDIARFIVHGAAPSQGTPPFSATQNKILCIIGRVSFFVFPVLVMMFLTGSIGILLWIFSGGSAAEGAWRTAAFVAYLMGTYFVLSRV